MTTWMVVEDEPDLYDMVLAMYDTLGVNGVAFATGEEAMEWIEAIDDGHFHDEIPELALIDIRLPGDINGPMVGARMRKSPMLKNTAIALMTAYKLNPTEERQMMHYSKSDKLFYKPLPPIHEFEAILRRLIAVRNRRG
ncbi:MAG: response regulator [Chloroflexota bacterium]